MLEMHHNLFGKNIIQQERSILVDRVSILMSRWVPANRHVFFCFKFLHVIFRELEIEHLRIFDNPRFGDRFWKGDETLEALTAIVNIRENYSEGKDEKQTFCKLHRTRT